MPLDSHGHDVERRSRSQSSRTDSSFCDRSITTAGSGPVLGQTYAGVVSPTRISVDPEILRQVEAQTERLRKLRKDIEEQQENLKTSASAREGTDRVAGVAMEAARLQALTTDLSTSVTMQAAELVAAALDHSTKAANQGHDDVMRWQKFAAFLTLLIILTMVLTSPWCAPPSTIVVESLPDSPPDTPLPVTRLESSAR